MKAVNTDKCLWFQQCEVKEVTRLRAVPQTGCKQVERKVCGNEMCPLTIKETCQDKPKTVRNSKIVTLLKSTSYSIFLDFYRLLVKLAKKIANLRSTNFANPFGNWFLISKTKNFVRKPKERFAKREKSILVRLPSKNQSKSVPESLNDL